MAKRNFNFNQSNEFNNIKQKTVSMNKDKNLVWLDPKSLIDDEENEYFYGNYQEDVKQLAESIKRDKFSEVIFAYKIAEGYKIRAGHRRKYAAISAGLNSVPVVLEQPPKNYYDRIIGLLDSNNNGREQLPLVLARTAAKYFEVIQDRRNNDAEYAEQVKGIPTKDLVADKMGKSASLVSKYASLMKLIPVLQEKANNPDLSWSSFSLASSLSNEKQELLNEIIDYEIEEHDITYIKRGFLNSVISDLKDDAYDTIEEYKCLTVRQQKVDAAMYNAEKIIDAIAEEGSSSNNSSNSNDSSSSSINTTQNIVNVITDREEAIAQNYAIEPQSNDMSLIEPDEKITEFINSTGEKNTNKSIYDFITPVSTNSVVKKSKRADTIRSSAISLTSLLDDDVLFTEEELLKVKPALIGLKRAIQNLIEE